MKWTRFAYGLPLLLLLLWCTACAPGRAVSASHGATHGPTPTAITRAATRIHNVAPGGFSLFARITFTRDTTYDQAAIILGGRVYPWTCDAPRSPTPPPIADQRAGFADTHTLLISYAGWSTLERIAASPQVISVDGIALYQCS